MGRRAIFVETFLDGFTMAGFLGRLRHPGEATRLMEPPVERDDESVWVFEMGAGRNAQVALAGDLHSVPEQALREMMILLERERESRKVQSAHPA